MAAAFANTVTALGLFLVATAATATTPESTAQSALDPPPPFVPKAVMPPPPPAPRPVPGDKLITCKSCPEPWYPLESYFVGAGGTVVLLIVSDAQGQVLDVSVESSSRSRELDRWAINQARTWIFDPGIVQGKKVGGTVRVPVQFIPMIRTSPTLYEGEQKIPLALSPQTKPIKWGDAPAVDEVSSVAQANEFIEHACLHDSVEQGKGYVIYRQLGDNGFSYWTFFDAESGWGPSVVRRRYATGASGTVLKTSYVCQGDAPSCKALRDHLDRGFSGPISTPATLPGKPLFPKCDSR
jgi:TonB family protein